MQVLLYSLHSNVFWYDPIVWEENDPLLDELHGGSRVRHDEQVRGGVCRDKVRQARVGQLLHSINGFLVSYLDEGR